MNRTASADVNVKVTDSNSQKPPTRTGQTYADWIQYRNQMGKPYDPAWFDKDFSDLGISDPAEEEIQIRTAMSSHWMTLGKFKAEPKPEPDPDVKVIRSYIRGDGKQVEIMSDGTTRLTEPEYFGGFPLQ